MRQEDLNEMMRLPWERKVVVTAWCQCPKCGENYCGDGVLPCTECEYAQQQGGRANVANAIAPLQVEIHHITNAVLSEGNSND